MSTHNLCFRAKRRKNVFSCTPQFYYIKVGCKGVYITRTCFHAVLIVCLSKTVALKLGLRVIMASLITRMRYVDRDQRILTGLTCT